MQANGGVSSGWWHAGSMGAAPAGALTVFWQHGHAQARLVQLHPPPVIVLLHALHRRLVQLQVGAKRGCRGWRARRAVGCMHL